MLAHGLGGLTYAEPIGRPNVLWITLEDISPSLGCYGDPDAVTPNIDRLATQGVRYTRASSNAGMCAVARATLITGMYPPSTGAMHMRSEAVLPETIRGYPEFLRRAGYFCSNHSKTDYNWIAPTETWDINTADWRHSGWRMRKSGQPFFTVINITDTHSSQLYFRGERNWAKRLAALPESHRHDPARVTIPPYYPDTPEVRGDLARYHDNISFADLLVQEILEQLEDDGLADDTIIFFYSDHGMGMPRAKGWCFESSLRIPLIIRFPEKWQQYSPGPPGSETDRLVSFVDFAPTLLSLCGVEIPEQFQGSAFLGQHEVEPRQFQFTYRDRMDERYELIRGVSDGRFKYLRNYLPHLPWFHEQTRLYPSGQPSYQVLHRLSKSQSLKPESAQFMSRSKPREQLFDLASDPHELVNLIDDQRYAEQRESLRVKLRDWTLRYHDLGFLPECDWQSPGPNRPGGQPVRTATRNSSLAYPLQRVLEVAELVGLGPEVLQRQTDACVDTNARVRYWGAIGLFAQETIHEKTVKLLEGMLEDDLASCRVAAAEAVIKHADSPDEAIRVLVKVAMGEHYYARLLAINVLNRQSARIRPNQIESLRYLLGQKPVDWIDRSMQQTIWRILNGPA